MMTSPVTIPKRPPTSVRAMMVLFSLSRMLSTYTGQQIARNHRPALEHEPVRPPGARFTAHRPRQPLLLPHPAEQDLGVSDVVFRHDLGAQALPAALGHHERQLLERVPEHVAPTLGADEPRQRQAERIDLRSRSLQEHPPERVQRPVQLHRELARIDLARDAADLADELMLGELDAEVEHARNGPLVTRHFSEHLQPACSVNSSAGRGLHMSLHASIWPRAIVAAALEHRKDDEPEDQALERSLGQPHLRASRDTKTSAPTAATPKSDGQNHWLRATCDKRLAPLVAALPAASSICLVVLLGICTVAGAVPRLRSSPPAAGP